MEALVNFLSGFGDVIVSVWEFFITFFRDFMSFLELLVKMPAILTQVLSWIPSEIWVSLTILFTVVILYKVLGREG